MSRTMLLLLESSVYRRDIEDPELLDMYRNHRTRSFDEYDDRRRGEPKLTISLDISHVTVAVAPHKPDADLSSIVADHDVVGYRCHSSPTRYMQSVEASVTEEGKLFFISSDYGGDVDVGRLVEFLHGMREAGKLTFIEGE